MLLITDGYFQYFFKANIIGNPVDLPSGRIRFLFNDEYILGSFISRLFPLFLGLSFIIFKNKKKFIIPVSILFFFFEVLIFLSGERTAFFYNTFLALFIIIMINNFKNKINYFFTIFYSDCFDFNM